MCTDAGTGSQSISSEHLDGAVRGTLLADWGEPPHRAVPWQGSHAASRGVKEGAWPGARRNAGVLVFTCVNAAPASEESYSLSRGTKRRGRNNAQQNTKVVKKRELGVCSLQIALSLPSVR